MMAQIALYVQLLHGTLQNPEYTKIVSPMVRFKC